MQRLLPFVLRNAGSLLALAGGILALSAFFFLPYYWATVVVANESVTSFHYVAVMVTGVQLASERLPIPPGASTLPAYNGLVSIEVSYGQGGLSLLWFEPLVALLSLFLASLLLARPKQVKPTAAWWLMWLLIASPLLSLVFLLGYTQENRGWNFSTAWGFWVLLLAMVLTAVGGVLIRFSHRTVRSPYALKNSRGEPSEFPLWAIVRPAFQTLPATCSRARNADAWRCNSGR